MAGGIAIVNGGVEDQDLSVFFTSGAYQICSVHPFASKGLNARGVSEAGVIGIEAGIGGPDHNTCAVDAQGPCWMPTHCPVLHQ